MYVFCETSWYCGKRSSHVSICVYIYTGSTSIFQLHFSIEILMRLVRDSSMLQVRKVSVRAQVNVKIFNAHFKSKIVYSAEKPVKLRRKKINNGNKSSKKWHHLGIGIIQVWNSISRTPKSSWFYLNNNRRWNIWGINAKRSLDGGKYDFLRIWVKYKE